MKQILFTTFGAVLGFSQIIEAYKKFFIENREDRSYEFTSNSNVILQIITGKTDKEKELPSLSFPIFIEMTGSDKVYLVIDVRSFVQKKPDLFAKVSEIVTNTMEFNYVMTRAMIELDLYNDRSNIQKYTVSLAYVIRKWTASFMKSSYNLDAGELIKIEIMSTYYYLAILSESMNDNKAEALYGKVAKQIKMGVTPDMVKELITKSGNNSPTDLHDFCDMLRSINEIKLKGLDINTFNTITKNTWFGKSTLDNVLIFENPATLVAMTYFALEEKGYKRTRFSLIMQGHGKQLEKNDFIGTVKKTIKQYKI